MKIGVLAVQGAFREHMTTLAAISGYYLILLIPAALLLIGSFFLPGGAAAGPRARLNSATLLVVSCESPPPL